MAIGMTQALHRAVQQFADRTATVSGNRRQTYRQLHERVGKLAGALRALGVNRGDRVAILALNSDRYLECFLAGFWLGAAVQPANTRWSAAEHVYSFNDGQTSLLLVDEAFTSLLPAIRAESKTLREVVFMGDGAQPDGTRHYETLIATHEAVPDVNASGADVAGLFYTGGTTGFPKGVMLSHEGLIGPVLGALTMMDRGMGDVTLNAAPVFHLAGAMQMFMQLSNGGTEVMLPSFTPEGLMELVQRERVTDTLLIPTMIQMVLDHPKFAEYDMSSLRTMIYGGSPIAETILDRATQAWPQMGLMQGYGMTETSGAVTFLQPYYHSADGRKLAKLRSCGRACPTILVKIVDDQGVEVPRGTVGEIAMAGMSTMLGYWNKPAETAATLKNGWVHSGDGAYMDDEGFIFIVDRMKDMIVSGGENVYSAEVENAVAKHAAVASCAVVGIPHERWGEQVHAIVVLKAGQSLTEDELIAHCRTLIANYKCPRSVEVRDALPLSGAGKILKAELRAPFWKGAARGVN
ncbi:MAG: long-chain fatty acid--CoA ligase [Burkholderiales bacterium]